MDDNNIVSELNKSLKSKLYDRLTDPFLGSYTIFFITFNWKFFYILFFSDKNVYETISYIENVYFKSWSVKCVFFICPLIASAIYVFLYPYFKKFVYRYSYYRKVQLKNLKKTLEESEVLTIKEAQELKRKELHERKILNVNIDNMRVNLNHFISYLLDQYATIHKVSDRFDLSCVLKNNDVEVDDWVFIQSNIAEKSQYGSDRVYGLVTDIINNTYCIVQRRGQVELKNFEGLVANKTYMLSGNTPGKMEELNDKTKRRVKLGVYKGNAIFVIDITGYNN